MHKSQPNFKRKIIQKKPSTNEPDLNFSVYVGSILKSQPNFKLKITPQKTLNLCTRDCILKH